MSRSKDKRLKGEQHASGHEEHSTLNQSENLMSEEQLAENNEEIIAFDLGEGEQHAEQQEEHSTEHNEESSEVPAETDEPEALPVAPVMVLGIGQFVRQMLLKSTKTNAEILALTLQVFPDAKTTPACIAWYKSDLRKKGLLSGTQSRGPQKLVQFTQEMLDALIK
jgi:hypothetical protein